MRVAVLELECEDIAGSIAETGPAGAFSVLRGHVLEEFAGVSPELLIVSEGAADADFAAAPEVKCGCALLPGKAADMLGAIKSGYIVSYGMSPKDTVTLSSIEDGKVMLSLQRELVLLDGKTLEQQEIAIHAGERPGGEVMAVKAAQLIMGAPVSAL